MLKALYASPGRARCSEFLTQFTLTALGWPPEPDQLPICQEIFPKVASFLRLCKSGLHATLCQRFKQGFYPFPCDFGLPLGQLTTRQTAPSLPFRVVPYSGPCMGRFVETNRKCLLDSQGLKVRQILEFLHYAFGAIYEPWTGQMW